METERLLDRVAAGDEQALAALYDQTLGRTMRARLRGRAEL